MIVHHRIPICNELGKIIGVDKDLIEILTPIQKNNGAKLTIYIRNDSSDKHLAPTIVKIVRDQIHSGELAKVM